MEKKNFRFTKLLDLIYPPRCFNCDVILKKGEFGCCQECYEKLPWVSGAVCMKCGRPVAKKEQEYCPDCQKQYHYYDQGAAAFVYTGMMRKAVSGMKFSNRKDSVDFFGYAMIRALERTGHLEKWQPDLILPVPMHPRKKRRRGYNQAELLAEQIGLLTGIPVNERLIRCVKQTTSQKQLNRRERLKNLKGAFETDDDFPPVKSVLLVDDVYTTGSTVDEISRVLREAGVQRIFFIALCIGNRKKAVSTAEKLCYT